ncbi:hypothetical protein ACFSR9_03235 [Deinococcus taklimakanensis]|uniref:Uncharacterized protein n=1 Tax=Deinococcus taklimakanensis TaxID=536443 RepID=A0ABW5P2J0_9DEIO
MNGTVELSLSEAITLIDIFREDGRFDDVADELTEALAMLVGDGFTITADLADDMEEDEDDEEFIDMTDEDEDDSDEDEEDPQS